jgi:hypothetical protein
LRKIGNPLARIPDRAGIPEDGRFAAYVRLTLFRD